MIKHFILDVDGVMTTGHFIYGIDGKLFKIFGPHDSDGLKLIRESVNIQFITADDRGFDITKKRIVDDMKYPLTLVKEENRFEYIKGFDFDTVAFMGDGYFDSLIMPHCYISITPVNSRVECKKVATYITPSKSGEGAVMDACLFLKEHLNA
jgi:3-deoxy-D-manno-octulosonate 8-phosphate phosphatase (KDO 8-P phosphatase)